MSEHQRQRQHHQQQRHARRPQQRVIPGRLKVEYPGEAHRQLYEVAMLYCRLREGTPGDRGGRLFAVVEGERVAVHGEEGGTRGTAFDVSEGAHGRGTGVAQCSAVQCSAVQCSRTVLPLHD